ncbi:MAG: nucleotidyltransferase family protein [Acidobacteria bacterium]|nr:nucleotidyltransferase family protein [Acidobacteriota bacterium]
MNAVLRAVARGERVSGPLDPATLEAAVLEGLGGLLFHLADAPPRELRIRAATIEARALHLGEELRRVLAAFDFPVLALKGGVMAQQLYGDSTLRVFADLDLIVDERDADRGEAVLQSLGYRDGTPLTPARRSTKRRFHSGSELVHETRGIVVDFHWRFGHPQFPLALPFADAYARRAIVDGIPTLGLSDLAVFACSHAAKHFWFRLEMLAQIAALTRLAIDWEEVDAIAVASRAARQVGLSFLLVEDSLGVVPPPLPRCLAAARPHFPALRDRLSRAHDQDPRGRDLFLLFDRKRDVVTATAAAIFVPTPADWATSQLPDALQWIARPLRLVGRRLSHRWHDPSAPLI